jgi:proline iminopeptidase
MKSKDRYLNAKGFFDTGDGHEIYWEDWGNPKGTPIFLLHGGPGGGFSDKSKLLFDPKRHHVIFHDQRGSKRSRPFASTKNNTTQDLICDIESLRQKFGFKKITVVGGSWGSTLSLSYALTHPDRVKKLLIWSVFLNSQFEIDFVNEGYGRYFFAEAWERFIALVPKSKRKTGNEVMAYYGQMINSKNKKLARKYANEWTLYEYSLCSINYNPNELEKYISRDKNTVAIANLEIHYFSNHCFFPDNHILKNINKIKHLPCQVVQGRFDMCTPTIAALNLKKAYGKKLKLKIVNSGHMPSDPEMAIALKKAIKKL